MDPNTVVPIFPNPWPFNGDFKFEEEVRNLVEKYDLKWIVETGTSSGNSTRSLARMFDTVHTIEVNPAQYEVTAPFLEEHHPNVTIHQGNSGEILADVIKNAELEGRGAFYLDAHWRDEWPLLDELKAISESPFKGNCIVMIDDMEIPGVVAGDRYGDRVLNIEYVKKDLMETGAGNYRYHYPEKEMYRGKLIATPWTW